MTNTHNPVPEMLSSASKYHFEALEWIGRVIVYALRDGERIGQAYVDYDGEDAEHECRLTMLLVEPAHQRKGVARIMVMIGEMVLQRYVSSTSERLDDGDAFWTAWAAPDAAAGRDTAYGDEEFCDAIQSRLCHRRP